MYEGPAVAFMPQGPEGPWSGPEYSTGRTIVTTWETIYSCLSTRTHIDRYDAYTQSLAPGQNYHGGTVGACPGPQGVEGPPRVQINWILYGTSFVTLNSFCCCLCYATFYKHIHFSAVCKC